MDQILYAYSNFNRAINLLSGHTQRVNQSSETISEFRRQIDGLRKELPGKKI